MVRQQESLHYPRKVWKETKEFEDSGKKVCLSFHLPICDAQWLSSVKGYYFLPCTHFCLTGASHLEKTTFTRSRRQEIG